jgi:hypothetical protein
MYNAMPHDKAKRLYLPSRPSNGEQKAALGLGSGHD